MDNLLKSWYGKWQIGASLSRSFLNSDVLEFADYCYTKVTFTLFCFQVPISAGSDDR
jgi:hypothetical protein